MSEIIKIKRGLDIKLLGKADKTVVTLRSAGLFAVKPTDFIGLIPKLNVKPGDPVKVGTPLFFDKNRPEIKFVSPVSGTVKDVSRGEKRKVLAVVVESDEKNECINFQTVDPSSLSRDKVKELILESGLWPLIRQRPYSVVANPNQTPNSVFISGFDTAPLAPDLGFIMTDMEREFQTGINALKKLTDGKVHLGLPSDATVSQTMAKATGIELHYFKGPHPAGNVGIQIHHTSPINKGDLIWVLSPQSVAAIGKLFLEGKYDNSLTIAVTGAGVSKPAYYKITRGCSIASLTSDNLIGGELRIISGNVLTGTKVLKDGFLCFYDNQLTVIPEGNYFDFLGWALPGLGKYSTSRSFFSWLTPKKEYSLDTNLKGGERAFVMTGEYEKVLPMDIYPVQLLKAILAENVDKMEQLGIYEVVEEDLALCEFVCTSKAEVQLILRKGLDLIKKEME